MLYLDHAATSPVRPEVLEAMHPYLTGVFGNPSSHHTIGEAAASALEDARARVATVLGMRAGDVTFTAGGTEANNLAVKGIVLAALASGRRHLVTTPIEHESILESAAFLERFHGVEVSYVGVDGAAASHRKHSRGSCATTPRWSRSDTRTTRSVRCRMLRLLPPRPGRYRCIWMRCSRPGGFR